MYLLMKWHNNHGVNVFKYEVLKECNIWIFAEMRSCRWVTGRSKILQWTECPSRAFLLSTSPTDPTCSPVLDWAADTAAGLKTHSSLFNACPFLGRRRKINTFRATLQGYKVRKMLIHCWLHFTHIEKNARVESN